MAAWLLVIVCRFRGSVLFCFVTSDKDVDVRWQTQTRLGWSKGKESGIRLHFLYLNIRVGLVDMVGYCEK